MMVVLDAVVAVSFAFFSFFPAVVRTIVVVDAEIVVAVVTLLLSCFCLACSAMVVVLLTVVAVQKLQIIVVAAETRIAAVANNYPSKTNRGSPIANPCYLYLAIISSNSLSSLSNL